MFISDFAIKRPLVTIVAMVALALFGLVALMKLKTDEFPDVAPPFVLVAIPYPGASPDGVANEILDPVEEQIQAITGVKQTQGKAYDGFGQILVEFQFGKDLNEATQEIRDAISGVRDDLPAEMKEPVIKKMNDTDRPIVSLALASTTQTQAALSTIADPGITRELRSIPGVAEVQVFGKVEREISVLLKPDALQANGVSVSQVVQALELQNIAAPVGRVEGSLDERSIRLKGRFVDPSEFANLVVATRNGTLVRLGQVADVKDGTEEPRSLALYEGRESVGLDIKKSKGYSTTDVSDRIRERVAEIQKRLPPGTKLELIKDAGVRVDHAVKNVEEALLEGAALTVLVVFLFLNSWRSTVITGLALPVSVLASFIAVWALGFKLETMSLLGLSLAIGILIDDAIVVRENIVRHVEMGKDHYRAAHEGTDEIGLAVAATTFSILAVFVPIGFMPGMGGQWFKPFALTIACSVLVSLFVSFSLDPMLSAYWADPHVPAERRGWLTRKLDAFNAWFNRQAENYKKVIAWALDHRAAMVAMAIGTFFASFTIPSRGLTGLFAALAGVAVIVFALTRKRAPRVVRWALVAAGVAAFVLLPPLMPPLRNVGVGFFPEDDRAEFTIALETPPGSNLDYTRLKAEELARLAKSHKEVRYTYTTLGGGLSQAVDVGNIYVRLVPTTERSMTAEQLAAVMRQETKHIAGATISVFTSDFGGGRKQLQYQLRGADAATLSRTADQVIAVVKEVPGAVDVGLSTKGQKPELNVELNRGVAGALGVTVGQIAQSLRPAFAGIKAGDWQDPSGQMRDVQVRLVPESRQRAADLRQLPLVVQSPSGALSTVPLGQVANVTQSVGPAIIDHLDREVVVSVEANTAGRASGDVSADIERRIAKMQLPPGVRVSLGGDAKNQDEVFGQIFLALGTAVLLMYLILVLQFGSFLDPIAILVSLPLSLIGVMIALSVGGQTINIMSLIGIILLAGIVAKNAILLIDFAKWAREERGVSLRDALIEAGAIRLRPILMTTFALIAGMLPVALGRGEGAQFRAPLGVAVIGGTLTSTLLTLLVIPTVYEILDGLRSGLARRFGMRPKQRTAEFKVPEGIRPPEHTVPGFAAEARPIAH
ncbi:acriflavin resistance protein [Gemmatirosa kalamazoonensis]|uniref:Acriflavin resistance protein n=1 Tax=Gemmatirosa kalamazoonensis TaxID=861299 RepID=W0REL8_9BACT|nr:efflux RND transporter permease subunit [Gemmatirosa kalamazoonensis]AHG89554.1 acriflavin resistance protein [Gemmatirosa kalamazoonensis]